MAINFTVLKSSIVNSSIWNEDAETCKLWVTMMALSNKDGEVFGSIGGLAHQARLSAEVTGSALKKFLSPDLDSTTKESEGRRIKEIPGGWILLNHEKVKDEAAKARKNAYMAEYMRRKRGREKSVKSLPAAGLSAFERAIERGAPDSELDAIITEFLPKQCQ